MAHSDELSIFTRRAGVRATGASVLFGQVMFLVSVALGFFAAGTVIGHRLSYQTGFLCEIVAIVMLLAQSFVRPLRVGTFAIAWLYALALLLGVGLGPVIAYYSTYSSSVLYQAAGGTALTVAGMGCFGFITSRDLVRWARPLFIAFFVVILASWVFVLAGSGGSPILSVAIYLFSAAFLAINFQYLRRYANQDDAVIIATGIFINVVNIFLALLRIFGNGR